MTDPVEMGTYRLALDGEWGLLDLSGFGRQYVQSYSFFYALRFEESDEIGRVANAFAAFPWRGGWSAVDFYESLTATVPRRHRPRIVAIEYASPGYIELGLSLSAAWVVSAIVRHICESINRINSTYNAIQAGCVNESWGASTSVARKLNSRAKS